MATYAFRILNVFARAGRLTGNPLCVFEDAQGLDDAAMQGLARQFNLSETTFILPSERASARVRIFTPDYEMPFAGHPTLGTAHVVRALRGGDRHTLEMRAGLIPVQARGARWTLAALAPSWREPHESRAQLAALLGLEAGDIAERPLWVKAGKEQLVIPLRDAAAVRRVLPGRDAIAHLKSEDGHGMAYVFADAGDAAGTVEARFFFPSGGAILEDPATGSACANLGGWFVAMRPGEGVARVVSQGEAIGRPSTLYLDVSADASGAPGIHVGGEVLELGRGTVDL